MSPHDHLIQSVGEKKFATVLADPPWRFHNKTGKVAPEHKRLSRYPTMSFEEIDVTEVILFGVRGRNARTLQPGRRQIAAGQRDLLQ